MDAGHFDELVTIESYTESVSSDTGERFLTWSTYSTAWAQVKEADFGQELVNAERKENKQRVNFMVRYDSGITPKMRINWGGNYYNILNVAEKQRRLYANLLTELTQ